MLLWHGSVSKHDKKYYACVLSQMATDTYIISVKPPHQRIHNSAGGYRDHWVPTDEADSPEPATGTQPQQKPRTGQGDPSSKTGTPRAREEPPAQHMPSLPVLLGPKNHVWRNSNSHASLQHGNGPNSSEQDHLTSPLRHARTHRMEEHGTYAARIDGILRAPAIMLWLDGYHPFNGAKTGCVKPTTRPRQQEPGTRAGLHGIAAPAGQATAQVTNMRTRCPVRGICHSHGTNSCTQHPKSGPWHLPLTRHQQLYTYI